MNRLFEFRQPDVGFDRFESVVNMAVVAGDDGEIENIIAGGFQFFDFAGCGVEQKQFVFLGKNRAAAVFEPRRRKTGMVENFILPRFEIIFKNADDAFIAAADMSDQLFAVGRPGRRIDV